MTIETVASARWNRSSFALSLDALQVRQQLIGDHHGIGAGPFGEGHAHSGHTLPVTAPPRRLHPHAVLLRARPDYDRGHVAHVNGAVVAGGQQHQPDIGDAGERLARGDVEHDVVVAHRSGLKRAIGTAHFFDELLEGDAEQGELFRIRLDADLLRIAARDVGQADIVGLYQLRAHFVGQLIKILAGPARGRLRLR